MSMDVCPYCKLYLLRFVCAAVLTAHAWCSMVNGVYPCVCMCVCVCVQAWWHLGHFSIPDRCVVDVVHTQRRRLLRPHVRVPAVPVAERTVPVGISALQCRWQHRQLRPRHRGQRQAVAGCSFRWRRCILCQWRVTGAKLAIGEWLTALPRARWCQLLAATAVWAAAGCRVQVVGASIAVPSVVPCGVDAALRYAVLGLRSWRVRRRTHSSSK